MVLTLMTPSFYFAPENPDILRAELTEQSGYGEYRVFTKVFKKADGVTPSQHRRIFLFEPISAFYKEVHDAYRFCEYHRGKPG